MTSSAVLMGLAGIILTFLPLETARFLTGPAAKPSTILMQVLGALYFAFAMLNWMSRANPIGGIYNRPVAVANFTHFMIATFALLRQTGGDRRIWIIAAVYLICSLVFGLILFRHPKKQS